MAARPTNGQTSAVASTRIVKQSEGSLGRDAGLFKSATGKVLVLNRRLISTDTTVYFWSHLAPGVPNRYCLGMQPLGQLAHASSHLTVTQPGLLSKSKRACLGIEAISRESTTLRAASTAASTLGRTYSCTCRRAANTCVKDHFRASLRQGVNSSLQSGTHVVMQLQVCSTLLCHDVLLGSLQALC